MSDFASMVNLQNRSRRNALGATRLLVVHRREREDADRAVAAAAGVTAPVAASTDA